MTDSENLYTNVERELKNSLNIILSEDTDVKTDNDSLPNAVNNLEQSIQKLQNFFTKSLLTFNFLSPEKKNEDEIIQMREELTRKDTLIKEQVRKLARYRMQLEVIQEAQMQARTKTL